MSFTIIRNDITKVKADAVVNAANTELLMGGGVCGAIFKAAGAKELQAACNKLAPLKTGDAVITPGFKLPAKHIIHTAGPVYHDGKQGEEGLLRSSYINSLKRAVENNCESIAFPLISSGIYGYPKADALRVATSAIKEFITDHDIQVYLIVFDKEAFSTSRELLGQVESFIEENYVEDYEDFGRSRRLLEVERKAIERREVIAEKIDIAAVHESAPLYQPVDMDSLVMNLDEPFADTLFRLIDAKGMTDVEVYKRANLDRRLFSRIRNTKNYMPSKRTAVALAVALELNMDEAYDLLAKAGFTLSPSQKFDVIIKFFIKGGRYDIFAINEILFQYDQPLLGS